MTLLPVVERELRVAARRPSTWWTRVVAAGGFLIILGVVAGFFSSLPMTSTGRPAFVALNSIALTACLLAGIRYTADAISTERREGTLGLLFLTDLRGHDVVLGKLIATSINAAYGVLAFLPVIGLPLLSGGVTGTAFWGAAVAQLNALWFSLSAGLFVSSLARSVRGALGLSALLIGVLTLVPPWIQNENPGMTVWVWFSRISPLTPFGAVIGDLSPGRGAGDDFWYGLLICQILAWSFIAAASWITARNWRVTDGGPSRGGGRNRGAWSHRAEKATALLDINPVAWLDSRGRWQRLGPWLFAVAYAAYWTWLIGSNISGPGLSAMGATLGMMPSFGLAIFKVWFAVQASHRFIEDRRSGAMELLLASPLTSREIIAGRWRALFRQFLGPVMVVLVVRGAVLTAFAVSMSREGSNALFSPGGPLGNLAFLFAQEFITLLELLLDLAALGSFGLWLGLRFRNLPAAVGLNFLAVLVAPWLAMAVLAMVTLGLTFSGGGGSGLGAMWTLGLSKLVIIALIDLTIIGHSRRATLKNLRELAAQRPAPVAEAGPVGAPSTPPTLPGRVGG